MYAPVTAQGLYGTAAAYGTSIPSNVIPLPAAAGAAQEAEPGSGAFAVIPADFWRSSGFGLFVLIALVLYFDLRVLNR
jgi:hypothetical protein